MTDDASITLDDLEEEESKNNTNQNNYVGSSNNTQKYPQALDLRQSHNSHNRPLHNSKIQVKPNDVHVDMACSESSLSVGDLLEKGVTTNPSSVGTQPNERQDMKQQQLQQQSNGMGNEATLSDGTKDATMDFDNTKNADFWGSVMSQMEFSFQNVMNFVSGKEAGKGERDH